MTTRTRAALLNRLDELLELSITERRELTDAENEEYVRIRQQVKELDRMESTKPTGELRPAESPPAPGARSSKNPTPAQLLLGMIAQRWREGYRCRRGP
jgi:hypothetical protein